MESRIVSIFDKMGMALLYLRRVRRILAEPVTIMEPQAQRLFQAIENLYRVFAPYRRPTRLDTDGGAITAKDGSPLLIKSLRELAGEEVGYYAMKALTTWGDADDYRYFLPRILELATIPAERHSWFGLEIILGKLSYAGWEQWPPAQVAALREFFMAWWAKTIHIYEDAPSAPVILEALVQADAIEPYLEMLRSACRTSLAARRGLAALVAEHFLNVHQNLIANKLLWHNMVWWEGQHAKLKTFLLWLFSDEAGEFLNVPFFDEAAEETDSESRSAIARMNDCVQWYQAARTTCLAFVEAAHVS